MQGKRKVVCVCVCVGNVRSLARSLTRVLKLNDSVWGLPAHVLDGVLVPEPVTSLNCIISVPPPVVFGHIRQGGVNTTLGSNGVRPRRKELGNTSGVESGGAQAKRSPQARTAGSHNNSVVLVVDNGVRVFELGFRAEERAAAEDRTLGGGGRARTGDKPGHGCPRHGARDVRTGGEHDPRYGCLVPTPLCSLGCTARRAGHDTSTPPFLFSLFKSVSRLEKMHKIKYEKYLAAGMDAGMLGSRSDGDVLRQWVEGELRGRTPGADGKEFPHASRIGTNERGIVALTHGNTNTHVHIGRSWASWPAPIPGRAP